MRYLLILLVLTLAGCAADKDKTTTADTDQTTPDATSAGDVSDDTNATESTGDAGCWWCVDTSAADTGSMVEEEKGEGKGDGKDDGKDDGKTPSDVDFWWGVLDPATGLGSYGYSRSMPDGLNCDIIYDVVSATAAEDCEACVFAWEMTLGDAAVITDEGGCGDAATLAGASVRYGHNDGDLLYVDEGKGWVADGGSYLKDNWSFFRGTHMYARQGGGEKEGPTTLVWEGSWSDAKAEGSMVARLYDGKTLVCDTSFPMTGEAAKVDCTDCDFAWDFTLGDASITDGEGCSDMADSTGEIMGFGHADPGSLYTLKTGAWSLLEDGTSTYEDGSWEFGFSYQMTVDTGKDGGEKTEK